MSIVCTICQDLVTERPQGLADDQDLFIIAVQCGHLFHRSCILEWFQKMGSQTENGQCPCCKTTVSLSAGLRIYPSGDEESNTITDTLGQAKAFKQENSHLKGELDQINAVLEDTGCALENERVTHEILKFEYAQKLSEFDLIQKQFEEKQKLLDIMENNWKGIVEKVTKERQQALEKLKIMEKRLTDDRQELETRHLKQIQELEEQYISLGGLELGETIPQNAIEQVDKSCQTDGRDAALLQARLVSYKSCLLHMESEVRQLEKEYEKLDIQSDPERSSKDFDLTMDFISGNHKKEVSKSDYPDSDHIDSIECGELSCDELNKLLERGDATCIDIDTLKSQDHNYHRDYPMSGEASDEGEDKVATVHAVSASLQEEHIV